jgi:hypothetical protein
VSQVRALAGELSVDAAILAMTSNADSVAVPFGLSARGSGFGLPLAEFLRQPDRLVSGILIASLICGHHFFKRPSDGRVRAACIPVRFCDVGRLRPFFAVFPFVFPIDPLGAGSQLGRNAFQDDRQSNRPWWSRAAVTVGKLFALCGRDIIHRRPGIAMSHGHGYTKGCFLRLAGAAG